MKTKHKLLLDNYRRYGEGYDHALPYNSKLFKLSRYGRLPTTRPQPRPSKGDINCAIKAHAEGAHRIPPILALYGASITQGLRREKKVWNTYFGSLGTINLGVGGDRTQHVLQRLEDVILPATVECIVIHCGTNNLTNSQPSDIASGVLAIGARAKVGRKNMEVIVAGLLHCDLDGLPMRSNVAEVNKVLRRMCAKMKFHFLEQDEDWLNKDGTLNGQFYRQDSIHLSRQGNEKFANSIKQKLTFISSSVPAVAPPTVSSPIVPPVVSPPTVPPTLSPPTVSCPSPSSGSSVRRSRRSVLAPDPSYDDSSYNHAEAMAALCSVQHLPHVALAPRARSHTGSAGGVGGVGGDGGSVADGGNGRRRRRRRRRSCHSALSVPTSTVSDNGTETEADASSSSSGSVPLSGAVPPAVSPVSVSPSSPSVRVPPDPRGCRRRRRRHVSSSSSFVSSHALSLLRFLMMLLPDFSLLCLLTANCIITFHVFSYYFCHDFLDTFFDFPRPSTPTTTDMTVTDATDMTNMTAMTYLTTYSQFHPLYILCHPLHLNISLFPSLDSISSYDLVGISSIDILVFLIFFVYLLLALHLCQFLSRQNILFQSISGPLKYVLSYLWSIRNFALMTILLCMLFLYDHALFILLQQGATNSWLRYSRINSCIILGMSHFPFKFMMIILNFSFMAMHIHLRSRGKIKHGPHVQIKVKYHICKRFRMSNKSNKIGEKWLCLFMLIGVLNSLDKHSPKEGQKLSPDNDLNKSIYGIWLKNLNTFHMP